MLYQIIFDIAPFKYISSSSCFIFTFIFVNLFNFVPALAEDRSYDINKVDIDAVIMDNGELYWNFYTVENVDTPSAKNIL